MKPIEIAQGFAELCTEKIINQKFIQRVKAMRESMVLSLDEILTQIENPIDDVYKKVLTRLKGLGILTTFNGNSECFTVNADLGIQLEKKLLLSVDL